MLFDRREALLGGAAALAVVNIKLAEAAPAVEATAFAPLTPTAQSDAIAAAKKKVSASLPTVNNGSKWVARKQALLTQFPWLKDNFGDEQSVDNIVYKVTSGLMSTEPAYDPYQIESLASSISMLLDRCLSYRNDMYSLEERAIKRCMDYALFNNTFEAQKSLELAPRTNEQIQASLTGQQSAVTAFGGTGPNSSPGFAAVYDGSAKSTKIALEWELHRQSFVSTKWDQTKANQDELAARYTVPGHALNYSERYDRLRSLLTQDVTVAFQKIRCLYKACNKVFDLALDLQDPFPFGYLDYLVVFVRDAVNAVEVATVEEIDFDYVVYLRQPRMKSDGSQSQLIDQTTWENVISPPTSAPVGAKGSGLLGPITLDKEFSAAIKKLRVRGVGLSLDITVPNDANINTAKLKSTSAVLFPPAQENLFSPGSQKERPPVVITGFNNSDLASAKIVSAPAVANIDPRVDSWFIQVSSNLYVPDVNAHARNKDEIKDIKLHLKLSALVDKTRSKWTDFAS